jgi:hypothetical protein
MLLSAPTNVTFYEEKISSTCEEKIPLVSDKENDKNSLA